MKKEQALANFLNIEESEARELMASGDYLVLTDEEATERAAEEIKNSLWAFNADFVVEHSEALQKNYERAVEMVKKFQADMCEDANDFVEVIIDDLEEFTEDAIEADGRGHFISWYDGEENEAGDFFIYRLN